MHLNQIARSDSGFLGGVIQQVQRPQNQLRFPCTTVRSTGLRIDTSQCVVKILSVRVV
jgi:hypothetical protein